MIRNIGITTIGTFIGQVSILIYTMLFAKYFGTSSNADAFVLAFTIVSLVVMNLLEFINSVFIPIITNYKEKQGIKESNKVFNNTAGIIISLTLLFSVVIFIFAPFIINITGSNFNPETKQLTVVIVRILSALVLLLPLTTLIANFLNTFYHFLVPAFGKAIMYVVVIVLMLFSVNSIGIYSVVWGMVIGMVIFFIFELIALKNKASFLPIVKTFHPAIKEMWILSLPLLFTSLANQVNIFVEKVVAGALVEGTIASLDYAIKLTVFPVTLGVTSIMTALFPKISEQISRKEIDKVKKLMYKGVGIVLAIFTFYAVFLIIFKFQLIEILFARGNFGKVSIENTALILGYYAPGVIGLSGIIVLAKIYYAFKYTKMLAGIGALIIILNIMCIVVLTRLFGTIGIPLSFSIVSTLHFILLWYVLKRRIDKI